MTKSVTVDDIMEVFAQVRVGVSPDIQRKFAYALLDNFRVEVSATGEAMEKFDLIMRDMEDARSAMENACCDMDVWKRRYFDGEDIG
jgi:hypothetical protein